MINRQELQVPEVVDIPQRCQIHIQQHDTKSRCDIPMRFVHPVKKLKEKMKGLKAMSQMC